MTEQFDQWLKKLETGSKGRSLFFKVNRTNPNSTSIPLYLPPPRIHQDKRAEHRLHSVKAYTGV